MTRKHDNTILSVKHPICCGLDVHKNNIAATLIIGNEEGAPEYLTEDFGTFTDELIMLKDWLLGHNCPVVAMESTSVYWRPVFNVLEEHIKVILVNARHIKNVPGRKTDITDSQWLGSLLHLGMLKASFIPEKKVRQWRELVTLRKTYVNTLGDYKRRVHKLFQTANIKIDSVVSDLFGMTGRNLMKLLCDKDAQLTLKEVEKNSKGRLKAKALELYRSIQGFFEDHHRFQLIEMLDTIKHIEGQIYKIELRLDRLMAFHQEEIERLDQIHGIDKIGAQSVLSHIGFTLEEFRSDRALVSWAGLCPGNNESAGKRKSGRSPVRKHPFKTLMIEIAWSAIKKKGSYYKDKYYRLKARRGSRRAIVGIANRITRAIYYIIKECRDFKDLGADYLKKRSENKRYISLRKTAKEFGFKLVPVKS